MIDRNLDASPRLLTVSEFSARSRLSVATIHRLKDQNKIPFYQPAGKGGRLLFPADAIKLAAPKEDKPSSPPIDDRPHLSGRSPAWMQRSQ